MQARQIEGLPSSIRRDGGALTAKILPKPPTFGMRRRPKFDAKALLRHVQLLGQSGALGHVDANETAMFARALLYVMPTPYTFKYPEIKYADLFPVNYSVPTGAKSHAYHEFDEVGNAQLMDSYADDAPSADVVGQEIIGQIFGCRSSFHYTIQDLRSMLYSGTPIDAMKAVAARRIIERLCDKLAAVGDTKHGFTGLLNDANAPILVAVTKAANAGKQWGILSGNTVTPNATAKEILQDCNTLLQSILVGTKGTHTPNTLLFGTQNWAVINTMRLDDFNQKTVADYLLAALPWVQALEYWPQLDAASATGSERIMATQRSSENYEIIISQEFEMFPPQAKNLAFVIPCHKRFGGIQMRFPKCSAYMDATVA